MHEHEELSLLRSAMFAIISAARDADGKNVSVDLSRLLVCIPQLRNDGLVAPLTMWFELAKAGMDIAHSEKLAEKALAKLSPEEREVLGLEKNR